MDFFGHHRLQTTFVDSDYLDNVVVLTLMFVQIFKNFLRYICETTYKTHTKNTCKTDTQQEQVQQVFY